MKTRRTEWAMVHGERSLLDPATGEGLQGSIYGRVFQHLDPSVLPQDSRRGAELASIRGCSPLMDWGFCPETAST
jgi:hypothetical protein